jgi:hypothetical protein
MVQRRLAVLSVSLAAVAMSLAGPAVAGPSIWVQCDGQPKPEGAATTAARLATVTLLGGFGIGLLAMGESPTGRPVASGREGVQACTAALADPALEPFWQRRVSILYSRAGHRIDMDDPQGALADLVEARGTAAGKAPDVLFERSIGVSAQMFEALLLTREGKHEDAARLASEAAAKRPWSPHLQALAAGLVWNGPVLRDDERAIVARQIRLDTDSIPALAYRLDASDDTKAAADAWEAVLAHNHRGGTMRGLVNATTAKPIRPTTDDPVILARAALAFARDRQYERASALLAGPTLARLVTAPTSQGPAEPAPAAAAGAGRSVAELNAAAADARRERQMVELEERAQKLFPLIRALIDEGTGKRADALNYLQTTFNELPLYQASADLASRLAAHPDTAAQTPAFLVAAVQKKVRPPIEDVAKAQNLKTYINSLPSLQQVGMPRHRSPTGRGAAGYKEEARKNGLPGVLLTHTSFDQYGADEVLFLRAAELAKDKGKPAFVVLDQMSPFTLRYGQLATQVLQLPPLLAVDFVDPAALPPDYADHANRVIMADEVIAALSPIYVDLPTQIEAAKRARR